MKNDNICKVDFSETSTKHRAWAKFTANITKRVNASALRYSRPFMEEEQRKYFMKGVALAVKQTMNLVESSSYAMERKLKEKE
jgi:hypothetical protein